MKSPRKRKPVLSFGRVLLPASKYHSTRRGAKGYDRRRNRKEEREARNQPWS